MTDIPFGFALPGGGAPDPNDPQQMARMFAQMQQFMTAPGSDPVNWDLARQIAISQTEKANPAVTSAQSNGAAEALRLADLWLESHSTLPSGIAAVEAWSRADWVTKTLDVWRTLCDPVASRMVNAMGDLIPEELRGQLGPMTGMVQSIGGALFGSQIGQALGSLAAEVLASSDIGLPVGPRGTAALVPANLAQHGEGLEVPDDEVRLYVALREAAHHRLFGNVGWLRGHVLSAVEAYAAGITINREAVEEALGTIDPTNPESMQGMNIEGVFGPDDDPQQQAALSRLETALALVEGWVTHIVDQAASDRLPHHSRLSEAFGRRRAEGGPAEQTFATLVGLQLRPRRLREAAALWSTVREYRGNDGRDAVWEHPDLLPTADDFADPSGFADSTTWDISDLGFDTNTGPEDDPGTSRGG